MERQTGVTILAILNFLGAAIAVLIACGFLFGGTIIALLGMSAPTSIAGFGLVVAAVSCFAGAVLAVLTGMGLLKLRNWARILTIVFTGLSLVSAALGILSALAHFSVFLTVRELIVAAIDLWIITYLFKPHVKQAFGATGF